jgi:O-methyltransferase
VVWAWPRVLLRRLLFHTPLRRFLFPRYQYAFTPRQLGVLVRLLDEARSIPGDVVEVGCFVGATTVFLDRHLHAVADPRRYLAIDTFAGFTAEDVAHEEGARGKALDAVQRECLFGMNDQRWFDYTMRLNGFGNVTSLKGDIKAIGLAQHTTGVAFALLDVDLYQPTRAALAQVWPLLAPGGVVVIDDCRDDHVFDGAAQAWREFTAAHGLPVERVEDKLAILRKPPVVAAGIPADAPIPASAPRSSP